MCKRCSELLVCAKEGGWGPRLTLSPAPMSWAIHRVDSPSPPRCSCTEHSQEEEVTLPDLYTRKFTGRGASAQSLWCPCVYGYFFPLNFQIFFLKQKYFFRYDNPERACWVCVYVLNSLPSHTGARAQVRGSSATWPGEAGGPPAACQGQARLQGVLFLPGRAGICPPPPCPIRHTLMASDAGSIPAGVPRAHPGAPLKAVLGKAGRTSQCYPLVFSVCMFWFLCFNKPFGKGWNCCSSSPW